MREMKDSGIEGVGEIPKSWNSIKIKYLSKDINEKRFMFPNESDTYIGLENVKGYSNQIYKSDTKYEAGIQKYSHKDNVLFSKLRPYLSKVIICPYDAFVSGEFLELQPEPDCNNRFLMYSLLNDVFITKVNVSTYGAKMPRADSHFVRNIAVCVCSIEEQKKIADYLDSKCSQIDLIIEKQKQIIEKLKEYKTSLITEVVTKGLDPNVEMKDSGVEWVGKIPLNHTIRKIKHCIQGLTDGTHGTFQRVENGKYLLSAKNVFEKGLLIGDKESLISEQDYHEITKNGYPQKGDILLCCVGTVGRCMIYDRDEPIAFQRSVIFIRCNNKIILPKMMFYCLQTSPVNIQERLAVNKSAQEGIYQGAVSNIYIVFPKLITEQESIITYLDDKCSKIEISIEKKEQIIEKLKEYKKSLIYEVVTGKREV